MLSRISLIVLVSFVVLSSPAMSGDIVLVTIIEDAEGIQKLKVQREKEEATVYTLTGKYLVGCDEERLRELYKKLQNLNTFPATMKLASTICWGSKGGDKNPKEALKWYEKAHSDFPMTVEEEKKVRRGLDTANFFLLTDAKVQRPYEKKIVSAITAQYYGVNTVRTTKRELLEQLKTIANSKRGFSASVELGKVHLVGLMGVSKSLKESEKWFLRAMNEFPRSDSEAMVIDAFLEVIRLTRKAKEE